MPLICYNGQGAETGRYFYHRDGLGSVVALSQLSASTVQIVESYAYDIHGRTTIMDSAGADGQWLTPDVTSLAASAVGNPYLFTGRRYDPETRTVGHSGLYYYRARVYHPDLMRFCQPDPIGYADSMNLYAYCLSNPLNWVDPFGLTPWGYVTGTDTYAFSPGVDDYLSDVTQSMIGLGEGVLSAGVGFVRGTWNTLRHPIQTGKAAGHAIIHPIQTAKDLGEAASRKICLFLGDDPRAAGKVIGEAATSVAITAATAKAAGAIRTRVVRGKGLGGSGRAGITATKAEFRLTETVAKDLGTRPYLRSPLTIREIMAGGKPIPDPGGFAGALRWDVAGVFNGSSGTWELVLDPKTNTVLHFLFKSAK